MRLTGIGVSPGTATGRALLLAHGAQELRFRVAENVVAHEVERLDRARASSRRQLKEIKTHVSRLAGAEHAYLLDAQLLMLDDPMLVDRAVELVRSERFNAEWAVRRAADELLAIIDGADDPYLRERSGDIADVVGRIGMNLRATTRNPSDVLDEVPGPVILVADELPASVAAQIDWKKVSGFVTDAGSWTYHTAILARSLGVPGVAGLRDATRRIAPGATVIVDGATGEVLVNPRPEEVSAAEQRRARRAAEADALREFRHLPAVTTDGVRLVLDANIERVEDAAGVRQAGAEGIGLYRTEYLLGSGVPDEEEQFRTYRAILASMDGSRVTIRTFDASERRFPLPPDHETAAGGLRGVRVSLTEPEVFRTQLRALLRAAKHGTLRIMFPFVTGVEELRQAIAEFDRAAAELRLRGEDPPEVPVGAMVEVPSAALTADLLARECQFLSIGTNDLIQYCLAADRISGRASYLYEPLHPAVLRMLRFAVRVARRHRRPLALCGEMGADPRLLPLLIGLGIREISMRPAAIPFAKQVIRSVRADEARALAARALGCATTREVERLLDGFLAHARQVTQR
ncbi:MAG TPA: phosphoenolpyruvate--protein phosphotransferase [Vicinamibacterales bacterium]|nr:phosphoenolpyruvate--protein phosphotransferase [Vicinamibacterales bacterium]